MQNLHRTAVGIDLGAKYTGVMIADTVPGTSLRQEDLTAFTVVMPDAEKMMLAQTQRTATRHRLRGKKRFNLARRLTLLVINEKLTAAGVVLPEKVRLRMIEAVNGLLRRRGYSRIEEEFLLRSYAFLDGSMGRTHQRHGPYPRLGSGAPRSDKAGHQRSLQGTGA